MEQDQSITGQTRRSDAESLGESSLFFEADRMGHLVPIKLKKRCIRYKDCVPGRTYMDSTSFSHVMKQGKCPLVAFSGSGNSKWFRGYLLLLGARKTIILRVNENGSFHSKLTTFPHDKCPARGYRH